MKKILILLITICCYGCSNDIPKKREQVFITKTNYDGYINEKVTTFHFKYSGHEYIAFKQYQGIFVGIVHNPDCPCKMK